MTVIPLVDLHAQHGALAEELRATFERVIADGQFILGNDVREFEREWAVFTGGLHVIGTANGTAALHLALLACGVGAGDEVITVSHTFIATTEAISYVGAKPVFVDVNPHTYVMEATQLARALTSRTKAILPVHLYGHPAPMEEILAFARAHGLAVIEDAAQAHGALYRGKHAGTLADVGTFSFFPAKNLGALGDAGAAVTGDAAKAERLRLLVNHGRAQKYEHEFEGYNYRLDTLHAALLLVKLRRLGEWVARRRAVARKYNELLAGLPLTLPTEADGCEHAYHLYVVRHPHRDELACVLKGQGIATGVHYPIPLHLQPAYKHLGHAAGSFPVTEQIARTVLSLPMYPELSDEQIERVASAVRGAVERLV